MKSLSLVFLMFFGLVSSTHQLNAQNQTTTPPSENLSQTILALDSEFWKAYNTCNIEGFEKFLTIDVEFYHDKGGLTSSRTTLLEAIKTGLCGNESPKMRRVVVEGSVAVYPITNYGAIITGEHTFYQKNGDQKERLVEKAKFTHIWQYHDDQWRMSRILSYDHQAISANSTKKEVALSTETLKKYTGRYMIADDQNITVTIEANGLKLTAPNKMLLIYPESETIFYHKEAPLTFEFAMDDKGQVLKFTIRENGKIVDKAVRLK